MVQVNCREQVCFLRGFAIYLFALISVNVKCALIVLKAFQQSKLQVLSFRKSQSLPAMQVVTFFFWILFMLFNKTTGTSVQYMYHESNFGDNNTDMKCMAH